MMDTAADDCCDDSNYTAQVKEPVITIKKKQHKRRIVQLREKEAVLQKATAGMPPRVRAGEEAHHAAGHSSSSSSDTDYRLESESEPESDAPVEEDDYVAAEHQKRSKSLRQKRLESLWKFLAMTMAYFRASCVKTALNLCKEDDEMLGLLSL